MTTKPLPVDVPAGLARPHTVVGARAMLQEARDGIAGLKSRIAGLDKPSTPASYIGPTPGPYVFKPESTTKALDVSQNNGGTSLVNFVVRSGFDYQFPVQVGGNGVFLAHRFRIVLWQRFFVGNSAIKQAALGSICPIVNDFQVARAVYWTTKFSLFPTQPKQDQSPCINYRWNILDQTTGETYSDKPLPATTVLNRQFINITDPASPVAATSVALFDGAWHEFNAPYRFDRAGTIQILFRPLTDIVQYDSSISGITAGLPYDDRENGIRNQSVYAQVEFQGQRIGGINPGVGPQHGIPPIQRVP